jgi:DNA polymerase-3 subunit delta'
MPRRDFPERDLPERDLPERKGPQRKGLAGLVGQAEVVKVLRAAAAKPVHAYLFVGPPGTGKMEAAVAFAAMLVCPDGGDDGCETCRRVFEGVHPDVVVVEREGAFLSIGQAQEVTRLAARTPLESTRMVIVLTDLHLVREAGPALLKTVEEPPASTVFLALAEFVPPELVTIASRCARVEFRALTEEQLTGALVAEGVPTEMAASIAALAGGRLDRARLLAKDPEAEGRRRAWEQVPARLDGTGATIAVLVEEFLEQLKRSAGPLTSRQEAELARLLAHNADEIGTVPTRLAQSAVRAGVRELEERHKREQRRQRTDELRSGLAALAGAYRDRAVAGALPAQYAAQAVRLIDGLSADLAFNPGEQLAVQALLVRLDRLA